MKAAGTTPLTITIDPSATEFVGQESPVSAFVPPLPLPLPPELCTSWDFFDPIDDAGSATSNNDNGLTLNFSRLKGLRNLREAEVVSLREEAANKSDRMHPELPDYNVAPKQETRPKQSGMSKPSGLVDASAEATSSGKVIAKVEEDEIEKELCTETEDPSEFITHRAKDFVSSMMDNWTLKSGLYVQRKQGMRFPECLKVETKKIRLDICANIPGDKHEGTHYLVFFFPGFCQHCRMKLICFIRQIVGSPGKLPTDRFVSAFLSLLQS